jgi:hypothetical protein
VSERRENADQQLYNTTKGCVIKRRQQTKLYAGGKEGFQSLKHAPSKNLGILRLSENGLFKNEYEAAISCKRAALVIPVQAP